MLRFILRRIIATPLLLLGVATVAFFMSQFTKGDPLSAIVPERQMNDPAIVAAAKTKWGLDKSLPERYLVYVGNLVHGDLGVSFTTHRNVAEDIGDRLPATLELVIAAMIIGTLFGIAIGVLSAHYRNRPADHISRVIALLGSSLPVFWSGLILLYVFSVKLGWLPGPGRLDARSTPPSGITGFYTIDSLLAGNGQLFLESLHHLILPAVVLAWSVVGVIARLVRSSLLDVLGQDYIRTARAKGAGELRVLIRHALRNALIPALTIIGFSFAYLITGAVLTETVFSWPGIGSYAVSSARSLDFPGIVGVTLVGSLAFLSANLLTDIAYALVNPKVKLQ
ncbi:peptide/nickel transport system permease protein [Rhizobium sp. PP-F2F-G38]|nr:peptide/nickel transport system permease protein [Rhizobium sp. PP-F2F-G20b]PYE93338.1 peptide/nickel transport system permease protein [Rhizobium sp. PP-F2F-G38]TCP75605.1 peptide/nickel transport system permease protein [Rhizobium sp. PP-CC-2G-626]